MYPLTLTVDYPGGGRNRLTAFFRLILAIPIIVVVTALATAIQLIVAPALLMILFRGKYPRWWFDFNVEWLRFDARINAYLLLLRDEYPSTDEEQAVHLNLERPERLNNFMPLIKWLLALPHYVVLVVLGAVGVVVHRHCMAGHPLHGQVSAGDVRLRRGRGALVASRAGVYAHPCDGRVSAVPTRRVGSASPHRRAALPVRR